MLCSQLIQVSKKPNALFLLGGSLALAHPACRSALLADGWTGRVYPTHGGQVPQGVQTLLWIFRFSRKDSGSRVFCQRPQQHVMRICRPTILRTSSGLMRRGEQSIYAVPQQVAQAREPGVLSPVKNCCNSRVAPSFFICFAFTGLFGFGVMYCIVERYTQTCTDAHSRLSQDVLGFTTGSACFGSLRLFLMGASCFMASTWHPVAGRTEKGGGLGTGCLFYFF